MSKATPDDQIRFLLSCVKHSNNGKVNMAEVAHECDIVSKGAATKRYNRLMATHGEHLSIIKPDRPDAPKRKIKSEIAQAAEAKRRKLEEDNSDPAADDADDGRGSIKQEMGLKQEPGRPYGTLQFAASQYAAPYPYQHSSSAPPAWPYAYSHPQSTGPLPLASGMPVVNSGQMASSAFNSGSKPAYQVIKIEDEDCDLPKASVSAIKLEDGEPWLRPDVTSMSATSPTKGAGFKSASF